MLNAHFEINRQQPLIWLERGHLLKRWPCYFNTIQLYYEGSKHAIHGRKRADLKRDRQKYKGIIFDIGRMIWYDRYRRKQQPILRTGTAAGRRVAGLRTRQRTMPASSMLRMRKTGLGVFRYISCRKRYACVCFSNIKEKSIVSV